MKTQLTAVYIKTGNRYVGYLKEYPEAISQGDTTEELLENLIDAMGALIEVRSKEADHNQRFPGTEVKEVKIPVTIGGTPEK
jgi:predicted RNase H-like HicB family nuclease